MDSYMLLSSDRAVLWKSRMFPEVAKWLEGDS